MVSLVLRRKPAYCSSLSLKMPRHQVWKYRAETKRKAILVGKEMLYCNWRVRVALGIMRR